MADKVGEIRIVFYDEGKPEVEILGQVTYRAFNRCLHPLRLAFRRHKVMLSKQNRKAKQEE